MVRARRNKKLLNEKSLVSMHYGAPITRSQIAVLDLFKKYSNNSKMFRDPELQSILEDELSKTPGRVMTRNMLTYRSISKMKNVAKLAEKQSIKEKKKSGISTVVKSSRAKIRKSRVKKRSGNVRGGKRRSRSSVLSREIFPKRKPKGMNRIRMNINNISKPSLKPLNVTEIQAQPEQENYVKMVYGTKPEIDGKEIYLKRKLDDMCNQVNKMEIQEQNEVQTCQMMRNDASFNQWQDQIYPTKNLENNMPTKKAITENDGFNTSQTTQDRTQMMNNMMLDQTNHDIYASRTLEKGGPSWNNTWFGKQTNILISGRNGENDNHNRSIKTASAKETPENPLKSDVTAANYKQILDYPINKNNEIKVMNDCVKTSSVPLWFGNAVTSVSSYVTKYMLFRS